MAAGDRAVSVHPGDATAVRRKRGGQARTLLLIPAAFALLALGGTFLSESSAGTYFRSLIVLTCLLTAGGAFLAARHFAAGDRLLVSWAMLGAGYLLAAIRHGMRLSSILTGTAMPPPAVSNTMLILQNVLVAAALLWFVLAWRSTGLNAPVPRSSQIGWTIGGIALALLVGGFPLMQGLASASADPMLLVSTLGDVVALALIVPLVLPALALRGGLLMYVWLFLAASSLSWLGYDLWYAGGAGFGLAPSLDRAIEEAFRMFAVTFAFIATIAQRRAVH